MYLFGNRVGVQGKTSYTLELGNHRGADQDQLGITKNGSLSLDTHCICVFVCVYRTNRQALENSSSCLQICLAECSLSRVQPHSQQDHECTTQAEAYLEESKHAAYRNTYILLLILLTNVQRIISSLTINLFNCIINIACIFPFLFVSGQHSSLMQLELKLNNPHWLRYIHIFSAPLYFIPTH